MESRRGATSRGFRRSAQGASGNIGERRCEAGEGIFFRWELSSFARVKKYQGRNGNIVGINVKKKHLTSLTFRVLGTCYPEDDGTTILRSAGNCFFY